jgi:Xaa-Pro aminopeptidase
MLANLIQAEANAAQLFLTAEERNYFQSGQTEKELNDKIYDLAFELFGIRKFWHKRIIRSGPNTLLPYRENPPNRSILSDDILFVDFGPVFEDWEADVGMTFVIGNDPIRKQLKEDVEVAWQQGKAWFQANPHCTGAELYAYTAQMARQMGWEFGGPHCGHLIGRFPHERIEGEDKVNYLHPENTIRLDAPGKTGEKRHWIYEMHLIDPIRKIGAFHEAILTI